MSSAASIREEMSPVARHIATAAARLFATRGYDATSVREIVEAAGVTKPTLYYHFGSKEGLAQALITVPLGRLAARLKVIAAETTDPVEAVEGFVELHFAFCREDPDRARFLFALLFGPSASSLAGEMDVCKPDLKGALGLAVRRLVESGVADPERAEAFATACHGLIIVSMLDFLYGGKPLEPGLARRLVGDLLQGFGTESWERTMTGNQP
jgi:AcrR family transcriptional regulator